ncbi:MAG TPA: hypothetical protein VJH94_02375, partial [Candidatus Paceibacterota bacterium]
TARRIRRRLWIRTMGGGMGIDSQPFYWHNRAVPEIPLEPLTAGCCGTFVERRSIMLHSLDQPTPGERRRTKFATQAHKKALERTETEAYERGLQTGHRQKALEMQPKIDEVVALLQAISSSLRKATS